MFTGYRIRNNNDKMLMWTKIRYRPLTNWTRWHTNASQIFHMVRIADTIWSRSNTNTILTNWIALWLAFPENMLVALITRTANSNATHRRIRLHRNQIKNVRNDNDGIHLNCTKRKKYLRHFHAAHGYCCRTMMRSCNQFYSN